MKLSILRFLVVTALINLSVYHQLFGQAEEASKKVAEGITIGNAHLIGTFFNSMVDLSLPGIEDSYGNTQAERIVGDFFKRFVVKSYKTTKTGSSNDGSNFTIGNLEAGGKTFRVFYLIKKVDDKFLVHQFQIQEE